jgi:SPP1 gp7 family putative phage head morphogenesis protein
MPRIDPRLKDLPQTVNELIADRAIRHALFLERYKTSLVNQIIKILNKSVEPKLLAKIEKSLRSITRTSPKLLKLFKENGELVKAEYRAMESRLYENLRDFAKAESQWQVATLKTATPIALDFVAPSPKLLKTLVTKTPMQGILVKDWFSRLSRDTAFKVNQQIQLGLVEGEGIEQIVRRIKGTRAAQYSDGILNISRHHLRAVVRSSVSHVAHATKAEVYKENTDVIKGIQIILTLDTRTCPICVKAENSGKVYSIESAPKLPLHFSCRCTDAPVLKSWKELGISLKEAPEGTRASMNGQVPENMTYPKWLKKQTTEIQNEALGKSRAKMFRSGKLKIKEFVDRRNRPLTLKQLENK